MESTQHSNNNRVTKTISEKNFSINTTYYYQPWLLKCSCSFFFFILIYPPSYYNHYAYFIIIIWLLLLLFILFKLLLLLLREFDVLFIFFIESVLSSSSSILDISWDSHGAKKALLFSNSFFGNLTGTSRGGNTQSVHVSQVDATRRLLLGFTAAAADASGVSVDVNAHALIHDGVGLRVWLILVHIPVSSKNLDINQRLMVYVFFFFIKNSDAHIQMMISSWAKRMRSPWKDKTWYASRIDMHADQDYHLRR